MRRRNFSFTSLTTPIGAANWANRQTRQFYQLRRMACGELGKHRRINMFQTQMAIQFAGQIQFRHRPSNRR